MARKRTLYVGSAAIRFAVGTPYIPAPNETIRSNANYIFAPDGRSLLCAVASARLGYDTMLCARVGDDYYGDRLLRVCREEGLHTAGVKAANDLQTELLLELVEQNGPRRTVRFPAAGTALTGSQVESAFDACPDAVVVSLESDPELVIQTCALAAARQIPFVLDATAPQEAVRKDFPFERLEKAEVLILNEEDTLLYSGINPFNEENRKLACYALRKRFDVKYILLQLGSRGCFLYDGKFFSAISAFDEEPVDPAGASEAFIAALVGSYLECGSLAKAAAFANAVYAKAASVSGGFRSLPKRDDL